MRLLFLSFLAVLFTGGTAQDWKPQGKIDSREIKIERREGNTVKGTEFVHYEFRVSLAEVPAEPERGFNVWCNSICNGGKHKNHGECDSSCDDQCNEKHTVKLQGRAVRLRDNMKEMTKTSATKARALGMPGGPDNWSSAASRALADLEAAARSDKKEFNVDHVRKPCTYVGRFYGYDQFQIRVRGEYWKVGYYMTGGVKTPINEMVDSQEGTVMLVYRCRTEPVDGAEFMWCMCEKKVEVPPEEKRTGRIPTFSGLGWRKPDGTVCIPDDKKVRVIATGNGLMEAEIRIDNETGEAYEVIIQPGTKLVPDDGGTQIMSSMGEQKAMVAASATTILQVSSHPDPHRPGETMFAIKVACTEMNKREPSKQTKFKILAPNDPILAKIAAIEDRGFMQGAVAQGRVWIYTDAATRDQINKKLLPGLTDGMYLNALHGLYRAGVDLSQPRYKNVLDSALLAAPTASREATFWYADFLRSMDPNISYAKKVLDAIKSGLATKAEALDARHAAHVAQALSESKDTRMLVLELMEKSIPEPLKAEFLKEGGLAVMLSIGTFGDDSETLKVFEVAKKFPSAETKSMLESFAFFGKESIRAAAEEASKGM